jgi:hypothetical protein
MNLKEWGIKMYKSRKRELREAYHIVAGIGGLGLGNFCRYAHWSGGSCCDSDLDCEHPLPIINGDIGSGDQPYDTWEGADCWGFRPNIDLHEASIQASIFHDHNFPHQNKKGEWVAIIPNEYDKETYNL